MSDTPLPAYVDARKAFNQEASVSGFIELAKLERVAASTVDQQGRVYAELEFVEDSAGRRHIRGTVRGQVRLVCQRCLEPVEVEISEQMSLLLVTDEEAARTLDKQYDPWLCKDYKLILADILDEQLLLGMPIVSYHQSGPCSDKRTLTDAARDAEAEEARAQRADKTRNSPFAALADLKLD